MKGILILSGVALVFLVSVSFAADSPIRPLPSSLLSPLPSTSVSALQAEADAAYAALENGPLGKILRGATYDPDPEVRGWVYPDTPFVRGVITRNRAEDAVVIRPGTILPARGDQIYQILMEAIPDTGSALDRQAAADELARMWFRIRADLTRHVAARAALDAALSPIQPLPSPSASAAISPRVGSGVPMKRVRPPVSNPRVPRPRPRLR